MCKQVGDDFYLQWKVENCPYHTTITRATAISDEIYRLRAENAKLRARLDKSVEFKYDIGDTVYLIQRTPDYPNGTILKTTVRDVEVRKNKNGTFLNYYTELDNTYFSISEAEINVFAFTDKAATETRLAELKGEK